MSDPKDTTSFFRKVVKFVANPATDWADLDAPPPDSRESEYAKSELKAMIERKRRNDFVRKREFDMLRKIRREGLTGEQLAALGGSSHIDDSDVRLQDSGGARADSGVKAKIDEIEQQMVGEAYTAPLSRPGSFYDTPTRPAALGPIGPDAPTEPAALPPGDADDEPPLRPAGSLAPASATMTPGVSPLAALSLDMAGSDFANAFAVEVSEVAHDPELDEAVIAFANADFELCEQSLASLTAPNGPRAQHAETWLALFDLYRATGQQLKFDSLALDYAQQFGWSAPQWHSMPQLVAETASEERPRSARIDGQAGWVCPAVVDADTTAELRSRTLQMPLPWVFDWRPLASIDPQACARLSELFRTWLPQALDMRWVGGEHLFEVLREATPTGDRDTDPAVWQLRLNALQLANRADAFDLAAIDYCITYEVSPPSWETGRCQVRVSAGTQPSTLPPSTLPPISEAPTSFLESQLLDDGSGTQVANVELSGQLAGDIGPVLKKLDESLGTAAVVNVSCSRLIRVDFIAAGDLLNWVLARRGENRTVSFTESHRLVALFFGAMGINEHAKVKVRTV